MAILLPPANPGSPLALGWPPALFPHCRPQFPGQQAHLVEDTTGTKRTVGKTQRPPAGTLQRPGRLRGDSLLRLLPPSLSKSVCYHLLKTTLTQVHNCLLEIPEPGMCQASTRKATIRSATILSYTL